MFATSQKSALSPTAQTGRKTYHSGEKYFSGELNPAYIASRLV
jgi:hypothetical protein